jgi:asparagine synthase (glutamine-hydrolysing)
MCGIFGALSLDGHPLQVRASLEQIARTLRHRGPDCAHILTSPGFALGAVRLRIIDLGSNADQPLSSRNQRSWLACNGEIYNCEHLRRQFPDYPFNSRSDLEPLLPLIARRGAGGLAEVDGMFALAAWDPLQQRLILSRDRAGEKPLFYTQFHNELWFSSEIAPLLQLAPVSREVDRIALEQYCQLGYVLEPHTLFRAVHRVEAGTALIIQKSARTLHRYWDPHSLARPDNRIDGRKSCAGRIEQVRTVLHEAVRKQVRADVPVGVFTSGGLDSSLITSIAARELGPDAVTTFCARFTAPSYDESEWGRRCAAFAGTRHVEVICGDSELCEALWEITEKSAEPVSDPAVLPTLVLAREARAHVRVVLTGEGADELFGGYPTYLGHLLAPVYLNLPPLLRQGLDRQIARWPASRRKVTLGYLLREFVTHARLGWIRRHFAWFGPGLTCNSDNGLSSRWLTQLEARYAAQTAPEGAMLLDYCTVLRDRLLVKSDRATMLSSIEARAPFLDRDVTALAFQLPRRDKVRGLTSKWILKQAARSSLPHALVARRKRGLSVPTAALIDGVLRRQVDAALSPDSVRAHALLNEAQISRYLSEHRSGLANRARPLWAAFILQLWAQRWRPAIELPSRRLTDEPASIL